MWMLKRIDNDNTFIYILKTKKYVVQNMQNAVSKRLLGYNELKTEICHLLYKQIIKKITTAKLFSLS